MSPLLSVSPYLLIVIGGLAMMMVDAFTRERGELATMSAVILLGAAGLSGALWYTSGPASIPGAPIAPYLTIDAFTHFFNIIICVGAAMAVLLAGGYLREHGLDRGEFYPILIFSTLGAMVLVAAGDLLSLFIGLETMSLGVYSMVAFRRSNPRAAEGAIKYFLLGAFAGAILLFGSALLYGATGRTDLVGIGASITAGEADVRLVLLAMFMLVTGLAFKVSAVPFHMWTPDAYEGAITPVTTFMAVAVKAAAVGVMLRVLMTAFGDPLSMSASAGWPPIVAALAAITMIYGNVAAVRQSSIKRMLAYSSIAHAGYLLVGVVATFQMRTLASSAVLYYVMAYTVSTVLAFGSLIAMGSKGREAVTFEDLAGAGRRHPLAALPFAIGMLSLMGFPPTAGFFGKYYIFKAAVESGGGMLWLAVLGMLTSAIGAYYYLRVLVYLFMRVPQADAPIAIPMRSSYVAAVLIVSGYFVLRMGVSPDSYIQMAIAAVS